MRWLARLYPRRWRDRYGSEVADLLGVSDHPWRDGADVAVHAALVWLEVPMVKLALMALAAGSLVLFGFSVGQLADGVFEIHEHWWSTASAASAICACAAVVVSVQRTRGTAGG